MYNVKSLEAFFQWLLRQIQTSETVGQISERCSSSITWINFCIVFPAIQGLAQAQRFATSIRVNQHQRRWACCSPDQSSVKSSCWSLFWLLVSNLTEWNTMNIWPFVIKKGGVVWTCRVSWSLSQIHSLLLMFSVGKSKMAVFRCFNNQRHATIGQGWGIGLGIVNDF